MSDYPHKGRPLPQWYDDSKFGIFIHWGPYAVPCYAPVDHDLGELVAESKWEEVFKSSPYVEWYLNSWSFDDSAVTRFHNDHFAGRTYESFADEFRERSSGADVGHWAELFRMAGAQYVVPVTKHHDGFLMWHSGVPNPHRDHYR